MQKLCLIVLFLMSPLLLLRAQQQDLSLDQLVQSAEQWGKENLDDDALRMLQSADQKKGKELLAQLTRAALSASGRTKSDFL